MIATILFCHAANCGGAAGAVTVAMRSTLGSLVLLASALHPEAQAQDPEVSKPNILLIVAVRSLSTAASAIDLESCAPTEPLICG